MCYCYYCYCHANKLLSLGVCSNGQIYICRTFVPYVKSPNGLYRFTKLSSITHSFSLYVKSPISFSMATTISSILLSQKGKKNGVRSASNRQRNPRRLIQQQGPHETGKILVQANLTVISVTVPVLIPI